MPADSRWSPAAGCEWCSWHISSQHGAWAPTRSGASGPGRRPVSRRTTGSRLRAGSPSCPWSLRELRLRGAGTSARPAEALGDGPLQRVSAALLLLRDPPDEGRLALGLPGLGRHHRRGLVHRQASGPAAGPPRGGPGPGMRRGASGDLSAGDADGPGTPGAGLPAVREAFPHLCSFSHAGPGEEDRLRTYSSAVEQAETDSEVIIGFLGHVRGRGPSPEEEGLLEEALEAVRRRRDETVS